MGSLKPLLSLGESDTFLTRIVRTCEAAGVEDVVVVAGHDSDAVAEAVLKSGLAARVVVNANYESGQFSSILAGLNAIDRPGVKAMLLALVDMPLVSADTVRALLDRYRQLHPPLVRPVDRGRHGHPIVIDRSIFDALRAADPAVGAKPIIRAHASAAGDVAVNDEGAFTDVDTPEEYSRLVDLPSRRPPFP
jgi:molybdenum cofactor cytidylyltransferase